MTETLAVINFIFSNFLLLLFYYIQTQKYLTKLYTTNYSVH